ncbi:MAG TPA: hypothetical protein EYM25_09075 [Deltaproteobacteria bacterium]|nr:hypothetical protein [Deltaproteobacteria bacterium]
MDIGFTPEVWQALLGLVLGTLILVISIASQSIPKLIDLYMKDMLSLLYVWFLIVGGGHALLIKLYGEINLMRESSRVFNTHILLTVCAVISFPYVFYILRYTKPTNIINRIHSNNMDRIRSLAFPRIKGLMNEKKVVERYQHEIFESLNQLDDILEYVSFKELKADIINDMGATIRDYMDLKQEFDPRFFEVQQKIKNDISYKTMVGQFGDMEKTRSFYEQKCYRLLGNVYIRLLERGEFDLSSLVASEVSEIGLKAIELKDDDMVEILIIRFNTLLRFAIKHAIRNNEPRNLYNLVYYYGTFVNYLVDHKRDAFVKKCFMYFRIYGVEIFKHGSSAAAMYFIVDVVATEMRKVLERIYEEDWDQELQDGLLNEILQVDNPPDFNKEDLAHGVIINNGVRVVQMALALFYQRHQKTDYVDRIVTDVLDDLNILNEETFRGVIEMTAARLRFAGPTFWEDTDRGNLNIYYTSDQAEIDPFKKKLYEQAQTLLMKRAQGKYKLTEEEAQVLWEMSRLTKEKDYTLVLEQVERFEQTLEQLDEIDEARLQALVFVRQKLGFTSDNPKLTVFHTRQVASGTELQIKASDDGGQQVQLAGQVTFNSPNYFYVVVARTRGLGTNIRQLTIRFKPPRRNIVYQFQLAPAEVSQSQPHFKLPHTRDIKIVEEH